MTVPSAAMTVRGTDGEIRILSDRHLAITGRSATFCPYFKLMGVIGCERCHVDVILDIIQHNRITSALDRGVIGLYVRVEEGERRRDDHNKAGEDRQQ